MVIIEGPDGAGKTTAIGRLSKLFYPSFSLADHGKREMLPHENVRARTYQALARELECKRPPEFHDRLYFSELVYGPILRGSCLFSDYEQGIVRHLLGVLEIPVIFCLPSLDVVKRNLAKDDHIEGVPDNIELIYNAYWSLAEDTPRVRVYDYTRHDLTELKHIIDPFINNHRSKRNPW